MTVRARAMTWELGREVLGDFAAGLAYEWLETNGVGGWASSTANGAHSRRYHGLLIAAAEPPAGRMVLLSPDDPRYRPRYTGGPAERDSGYHQGTVWPWLLGPYLTALVRVRGAAGREQARQALERLGRHLGEAGMGSISEIFDGEPPHAPRGCIAQAWSVGEVLRAAVEDARLGVGGSDGVGHGGTW